MKSIKQLPARESPSGFSDYNPFQSGGDVSERKMKKRKVRLSDTQVPCRKLIGCPQSLATPAELGSPVAEPSSSSRQSGHLPLPAAPPPRASSPLNPAFVSPEKIQAEAQAQLDQLRQQQAIVRQKRDADVAAVQQASSIPRSASTPSVSRKSAPRPRKSLSAILKQAEEDEKALSTAADQLEHEMQLHQPHENPYEEDLPAESEPYVEVYQSPEAPRRRSTGATPRKQVAHRSMRPPRQSEPVLKRRASGPFSGENSIKAPQELERSSRKAPLKASSFPATAKSMPLKVHHRHRSNSPFTLQNLGWLVFGIAFVSYYLFWRHERLRQGYCDTGTNSQRVLEDTGSAAESQRPVLPVLSYLSESARPACMPCPTHATCAFGKLISCDADYVRRPSPWSSSVLPLADRCVPDTEKLTRIIELAAGMSLHLRQIHGQALCKASSGAEKIDDITRIGMERHALANMMQPRAEVSLHLLCIISSFFDGSLFNHRKFHPMCSHNTSHKRLKI